MLTVFLRLEWVTMYICHCKQPLHAMFVIGMMYECHQAIFF